MKKIITICIVWLLCIPNIVEAKKWDFDPVGTLEQCTMIKYRCNLGWDYSANETHCWCTQILADAKMQKIDDILHRFIASMNTLAYSQEKKEETIEWIRRMISDKMFEHRENRDFQVLGTYIINKISEIHEANIAQ